MTTANPQAPSPARRRGDLLLESIYTAATEIINTEGYANLTFLKVAERAKTSRTVLYRRWETPFDLVRAIMAYRTTRALGGDLMDEVKDTGSLRGDLLHLLKMYQKIYTAVGPDIMNAMLLEMSRNNMQLPVIKDDIGLRNHQLIERILGFAQLRGEKIKTLSPATLTLPFDMVRVRFLWGTPVLDKHTMEQMVDEVLLPVFMG